MDGIAGKACVVTGSTKGIGLSVATSLAEAGADVVISARSAHDVERVAADLDAKSAGRVVGIACDVSRVEDCQELLGGAVEELGRLDVLVNNAGVGIYAPITELTVEDWQRQVDTNLGGVFYCSKAAVPHLMESDDGWIVNVGSLACRNPFAGGTGYNASKFGLLGLSEAMMLDLRHEGIRVATIMPGSVNTDFGGSPASPESAWKLRSEDVASAVLHLLGYGGNALVSRIEMRPSQPPKR